MAKKYKKSVVLSVATETDEEVVKAVEVLTRTLTGLALDDFAANMAIDLESIPEEDAEEKTDDPETSI